MNIQKIPEEKMKKLHDALRKMGTEGLQEQYVDKWCCGRPTTGRCAIVTEVILRCCAPEGYYACYITTAPGETHRYLRDSQGNIIDATRDQFDKPPTYKTYMKGKALPFHGGGKGRMSKYAKILAEKLGLDKKTENK